SRILSPSFARKGLKNLESGKETEIFGRKRKAFGSRRGNNVKPSEAVGRILSRPGAAGSKTPSSDGCGLPSALSPGSAPNLSQLRNIVARLSRTRKERNSPGRQPGRGFCKTRQRLRAGKGPRLSTIA